MILLYTLVNNSELKLDPNTNFIQIVYEDGPGKPWKIGRPITRAVNGSSIAVVKCFDDKGQACSRVYYQDPDLYLRERYYDSSTRQWVLGEWVLKLHLSVDRRRSIIVGGFHPGRQPSRTTITADVVSGGEVDINVTWRDAQGCAVSSSWSKTSGWNHPSSEAQRGDGRG